MLFSKTASELLRGFWLIDPLYADGYLATVAKILMGESPNLPNKPQPEANFYFLDGNAQRINMENSTDIPRGTVAVVDMHGPMMKHGGLCHYGADEYIAFAKAFDNHPNVIGQVWKTESGGGSVNSIAPYLDFLATKKKPVVELSDLSASASLWRSSALDYTFAENNISSMFGSVGIMFTINDVSERLAELGVKQHVIYADQSTHKNEVFRLALEGKYEAIKKGMLNPLAIKFQEAMRTNRPTLNDKIEGILSGKMFFAEDAVSHGLIDGIGNMQDAIAKVKELAPMLDFINN